MAISRSRIVKFARGFIVGVLLMLIIEYCIDINDWLSTDRYRKNDNLENHRYKSATKETRILCWIMTSPTNLPVKGKAIKETWGKRCDILLFMSSKTDPDFPAVGLDVEEGRSKLWDKTRAAFKYVYEHHFHDAEWFVKADDDTYMIIENLRYLLSNLNTSEPHFLGRYFQGELAFYNSGGAGYVFSRETLRRFLTVLGMKSVLSCPKGECFAEDVAVGRCLKAMGVYPSNTRDLSDRETFMPFTPKEHLTPRWPVGTWIYKFSFLPYKDGPQCCSDYPISFHYISPAMMYHLEYMVYRFKIDSGA